jgi:hypothetical protein
MYEPSPLPTFFFKNKNRAAPSIFFEKICKTIIMTAAIVAAGATIGFYIAG